MSAPTVESGVDDGSFELPSVELRHLAASLQSRMFGRRAGPVHIGRFVLLDRLGEGRMGVVHAAYDDQLDRKIAVKIQRADVGDAPHSGDRIRREAIALARLSHPNIVQVFEVGAIDGRWFVAMEFIRGHTLRCLMDEPRPDWRRTLAVYLQAGQGLAAAHAAGLVHRDFKPESGLAV